MLFRNYTAAFLWVFAVVFLLFTALMSWLVVRDGAPPGLPQGLVIPVLAFFWIGAVGFAAYAAGRHCARVRVRPDGRVAIEWWYPFKVVRRIVERGALAPARVFESVDDEGAPYFRARVLLNDGAQVDLGERHDREYCQTLCERFNAAAGIKAE